MSCYRCPHYVRHGQPTKDKKSIMFKDLCGLKMRQSTEPDQLMKKQRGRKPAEPVRKPARERTAGQECISFPFTEAFDYFQCAIYQKTFESKGLKNDVNPTSDFQFSEQLRGTSVTEMELL